MAIKLKGVPGFDTRGLPDDYDPHKFYEYRYETLVQSATGIESFAYKYIPKSLLMSSAFALDMLAPFKVASHRITPANRTRKRSTASVLQLRTIRTWKHNESRTQSPNYRNISVCWSPAQSSVITFDSTTSVATTTQPPLVDEIIDTTSRTRLMGSEQGTMRYFKSYINSPSRHLTLDDRYQYIYHPAVGIPSASCIAVGGTGNNSAIGTEHTRVEIGPSAAVFFQNSLDTLKTQEYAYLDSLIAKQAPSLLKEWSPNKRTYTLFRNLVELRDVPRSIASLQESLKAFGKLYASLSTNRTIRDAIFSLGPVVKQIPNEYLSYHFGWKQLYKDIMELLALPEAMSKKYSFLIRRAGKPTTFRSTIKTFDSAATGSVPGFSYTGGGSLEYGNSESSRVQRTSTVQLVINATFDFPEVNAASFRSHSFLDRIGLIPRPTDIYNLIPWTWLLDWFTGLGNYVEIIDNMARDDTLVNWGFITAKTSGNLTTEFKSKTDNRSYVIEDFVGTTTSISTTENRHSSSLLYECRIRKDVATVLDVKTTCEPTLTAYQKSILGAILAQRKDALSPSPFRPRT